MVLVLSLRTPSEMVEILDWSTVASERKMRQPVRSRPLKSVRRKGAVGGAVDGAEAEDVVCDLFAEASQPLAARKNSAAVHIQRQFFIPSS